MDDKLRINRDDWVAQTATRLQQRGGVVTRGAEAARRVPPSAAAALVIGLAALLPFLTSSSYVVQVGLSTVLFALLVVGLNVVVGWCGLIDLGYIAFYGVGAYAYAMLASNQFHVHLQAELAIPAAVAVTALVGTLVGATSWRVGGDYLAIVTLFFAQIFVTLMTTGDRITLPGADEPTDITGGTFGISGVDPLKLFGWTFLSLRSYYWFALVVFAVVFAALRVLDGSRVGRSWRSHREDPLAADLMGIPIRRAKVKAFVVGAAIAGLAGTVFAASQGGVFPANFDLSLLITVYAMAVLGGAGSLRGVVVGAVVVNVLLELLRTPDHARWVFYLLILGGLVLKLRPWRTTAAVVVGTVAFGFVVRAIAGAAGVATGSIDGGGALSSAIGAWMLLPADATNVGNWAYVGLVICGLGLALLRRRALRLAALVPLLYLAAFVWENRLVHDPSITRLLLLGVTLIALMTLRPQGLFGSRRMVV